MTPKCRIVTALAMANLLLAGTAPFPARAQTEPTVLAIPAVNINMLAEYVAEDSHLWEKQGLEVKALNIAGVGAINAVIANSADFSISSGTSITRAYARGQKLVALATAMNQSGADVVVRKDIAVASHFDPNAPLSTRARILKGRTIAMSGVGATTDTVLRLVAKSAGVAAEQMIITPMQPPEYMAAFARHAIDGFSGMPPYIQQVVLDGTGVIVSDSAKGEPTEYSPVSSMLFLARADFCAAHRPICEKMVRGVIEATRIIRNQPSETFAIMKARFGAYDDKALRAAYDMMKAMTPELARNHGEGAGDRRSDEYRRGLHETRRKARRLRHPHRQRLRQAIGRFGDQEGLP